MAEESSPEKETHTPTPEENIDSVLADWEATKITEKSAISKVAHWLK